MSKNRNYNYKDVDMLMASKTIMESFKANLSELSTVRTNWSGDYATALSTRIDGAIEGYLGLDPKKELNDATKNVLSIQLPAKRDLAFLKKQVEVDFSGDAKKKNEILKALGFTKLLRKVQQNDQEALIQLLFTYKRGMNERIKKDITDKGTDASLVDRIIGYANVLKLANVSQESLKDSTKTITSDAARELNEIYDEVIGICKIASNYYIYEPLKKEQFSFSHVVSNMNAAKRISEEQAA